MGQQQLILLVLATVIVGLAIVVGIRAFSENNVKSNSDAMVQDALRIASDAQAWMIKPQAMGGSPDASKTNLDWSTVTLGNLGFPVGGNADCGAAAYANTSGCYTITGDVGSITVNGTSDNSNGPLATSLDGGTHNTIELVVDGLEDDDITSTVVVGAYP